METIKYIEILNDKSLYDFEKMHYKYRADFDEFLINYQKINCDALLIGDFAGNNIVYNKTISIGIGKTTKLLMKKNNEAYGVKAAEDEIYSSNTIENINFSRDSIRNILKGMAPKDEVENRILGQKKGLEFIADTANAITEENIYKLYMMSIGDFLDEEDKLADGNYYRHDQVFVVGGERIEHSGIDWRKLPDYMANLVKFINEDDNIDDLQKAAIIHFYVAYLHPYFDGNGRMARLMHLWYLVQKGYSSALFVPFSSLIEKSRNEYYKAFSIIEKNQSVADIVDVSPFISYFADKVYTEMPKGTRSVDTINMYETILASGKITQKEEQLWAFVLSNFGTNEFTTKRLEKAYGDAAYATIRTFVMKFEKMGLLTVRKLSNKSVFKVNN